MPPLAVLIFVGGLIIQPFAGASPARVGVSVDLTRLEIPSDFKLVTTGAEPYVTMFGSKLATEGSSAQACPSGQVGTVPDCFAESASLGVDARTVVRSFDGRIKGLAFYPYYFKDDKPYLNSISGANQLINAIKPGILRYSGGLEINVTGFDRNNAELINGNRGTVYLNGQPYTTVYGTNELASVDAFAKSIGAQVMIEVNVSNNDPLMWADLVRLAKERGWTSFKYYEFGNELDLVTNSSDHYGQTPVTAYEYGTRVAQYQQAMLAVDPTIKLVAGVVSDNSNGSNGVSEWITQAIVSAKSAGRDLSAITVHWYPMGGTDPSSVFLYTRGYNQSDSGWFMEQYSRGWAEKVAPWLRSTALANSPPTEIGISEYNVDAGNNPGVVTNGNHLGALWFSDTLGRLAYNGVDWANEWNGYSEEYDYFGLFYGASGQLKIRPTYYAYLMYSKYFGDQMVKSSTTDVNRISIWASKDTNDANKLKLRITNMSSSEITTPVAMTGFSTTGGSAYVLSSTSPTDTSHNGTTSNSGTTLNGVRLDAMNIDGSLANVQPINVSANGTSFSYTIPAYSSVALVMNGTYQ